MDDALSICRAVRADLFDSVTTIGKRAFANCAQLKELTLPESITEIGAGAFEGLYGLEKLTYQDALCAHTRGIFRI